MFAGQQVFPHKYIKRIQKKGGWEYVYKDDDKPANLTDLTQYTVVIAHQKATPILVAKDSTIVYGPPQTMGKQLFRNVDPKKQRFGIARNRDGSGAVYFYPESFMVSVKAKKANKYLRVQRSIGLIDKQAEALMREYHPEDQQYGMAMWLNNWTRLRIGAHEDAASVDATERRGIINQARVEGWTDNAKYAALDKAAKQTFGLLTTRAGHLTLDPMTHTASWRFRGKGGKMITEDNVSVKLPPLQYNVLSMLKHGKKDDEKIFPDVKYKEVWRYYKRFGITPHAVRGAFADKELRDVVAAFVAEKHNESPAASLHRLRQEIKEKISDKLGHSVDMTLRAYVSDTTRKGYEEAAENINHNIQESFQNPTNVPYGSSLAQTFIWMEVGPGNEVI